MMLPSTLTDLPWSDSEAGEPEWMSYVGSRSGCLMWGAGVDVLCGEQLVDSWLGPAGSICSYYAS